MVIKKRLLVENSLFDVIMRMRDYLCCGSHGASFTGCSFINNGWTGIYIHEEFN